MKTRMIRKGTALMMALLVVTATRWVLPRGHRGAAGPQHHAGQCQPRHEPQPERQRQS